MINTSIVVNPYNTLSLLAARELNGVRRSYIKSTIGYTDQSHVASKIERIRSDRVCPMDLASSSAWNPRRLQNMILSVGLETPASIVKGITMSNSLDSLSLDGDEDDDNDDGGKCRFGKPGVGINAIQKLCDKELWDETRKFLLNKSENMSKARTPASQLGGYGE